MKSKFQFNAVYWVLIPALGAGIWFLAKDMSNYKKEFLGFAENKQSEINVDYDIVVRKIYVHTGDQIKKGDTLIIAEQSSFDEDLQNADQEIEGLKIKSLQSDAEIRQKISELETELSEKVASLETKIRNKESEMIFYKSLVTNTSEPSSGPSDEYIKSINDEIATLKRTYRILTDAYRKQLTMPDVYTSDIKLIGTKKTYIESRKKKLYITAPFDGIVGNISVREGENVKSFSSMVSLYESSPPFATGYINERFTDGFELGDTVAVSSLYHFQKKGVGIIMGKGHRIIEIPEKFRRIPEVKTYGVEVFIKINPQNGFFQKEVLKIESLKK